LNRIGISVYISTKMEGIVRLLCLLGLALQVFSVVVPSPKSCSFVGNTDLLQALNAAIVGYSETIAYQAGIYYNDDNTPFLAIDCSASLCTFPENPTGTLSRVLFTGKLRFGYSKLYEVSFVERVGQELARYISDEYEVDIEVEFVETTHEYPACLDDLENDKFDALFDGWSRWRTWDGEFREELADWTCSLDYRYSLGLVVGKVTGGISYSKITSFEDLGLKGLKIGVLRYNVEWDTAYMEVESRFCDADITVYDCVADLFVAVQTGAVNVIVASERLLRDNVEEYVGTKFVAVAGYLEGTSIAVRKDYFDCYTECPDNAAPVISNVQVYTPAVNVLEVRYTLQDDDQYDMVALYVSYLSDFVEVTERLWGSVGAGVKPGNETFVWEGALSGQYKIRLQATDGVRLSNVFEQTYLVEWPSDSIEEYKAECSDNSPYFLYYKARRFWDRKDYEYTDRPVNYERPMPMACSSL